jgi:hypothetical protein
MLLGFEWSVNSAKRVSSEWINDELDARWLEWAGQQGVSCLLIIGPTGVSCRIALVWLALWIGSAEGSFGVET